MSNHTCYQVGFAGVACGIARAALDNFVEIMCNKVPRGARVTLRDNAVVQSNLAQAEVNLRAARGAAMCCSRWPRPGKISRRARRLPWRSA
jgi:alkylation response protein AidB-like acyl-CoA dehydrogenase